MIVHYKLLTLIDQNVLYDIEDALVNWQDRVLVRLIVENVQLSEILSLKIVDVDFWQKLLNLENNHGNRRTIFVSDRCIESLEYAIRQELYYANNGLVEDGETRLTFPLLNSEYVVKMVNTNAPNQSKKPTDQVVIDRLNSVIKMFGLEEVI